MEYIYSAAKFRFKNKIKDVEDLARKLGVSSATVYSWISGKNIPPAPMRTKIRELKE